jgi:hypothetical protein
VFKEAQPRIFGSKKKFKTAAMLDRFLVIDSFLRSDSHVPTAMAVVKRSADSRSSADNRHWIDSTAANHVLKKRMVLNFESEKLLFRGTWSGVHDVDA